MAINDEIPKSRITLTYRTEVNGEPADTVLPFRMLVMGDFSKKTSAEREREQKEKDLDQRQIRNLDGKNLDKVMKDMAMTLKLAVPNQIDPDNAAEMNVELKIDSMKSFTPAQIAQQIPKVRAMLLLRKLLLEVQGNLDNSKEFRRMVRELAQDKEAVKTLQTSLQGFDGFKIPKKLPATTPTTPTNSTTPPAPQK
jgi:type VI secretion system protein ImpB